MSSRNETQQLRFSSSRLSAMIFIGLIIFFIQADAIGTTKDRGPGSVDNWPSGLSPEKADMFTHDEIVVHASASTVWHYLVAVEQWPTWCPQAQNVMMLTPGHVLRRGSKYVWKALLPDLTNGATLTYFVESTVDECIPNERLTVFAKTAPAVVCRGWVLIPVADGCKVVVEKTEKITDPSVAAAEAYAVEHRVNQIWLSRLKAVSESAKKISDSSSQ